MYKHPSLFLTGAAKKKWFCSTHPCGLNYKHLKNIIIINYAPRVALQIVVPL